MMTQCMHKRGNESHLFPLNYQICNSINCTQHYIPPINHTLHAITQQYKEHVKAPKKEEATVAVTCYMGRSSYLPEQEQQLLTVDLVPTSLGRPVSFLKFLSIHF